MEPDTPKTKKPFGKREWLFLIALIALAQLVVHMIAWRYASNDHALGYVSFAGTIIGIILAVIAIIYGFVQTTEQSNASSTIASQISSLYRVEEAFQKSAGVLTNQLEQLGEISSGITQAVATTEQSRKEIGQVREGVQAIKQFMESSKRSDTISKTTTAPDAEKPKADLLLEPDTIREFVGSLLILPALIAYATVVAASRKETDLNVVFDKYYAEGFRKAGRNVSQKSTDILWHFMQGYFFGSIRTLKLYISGGLPTLIGTINETFASVLRWGVQNATYDDPELETVRKYLVGLDPNKPVENPSHE
jgi:hypothetical protein